MNLHLYKVLDMSDYGNCDDLERTYVMTEKTLRKEFGYAVNNDIMPIQLMKDYQQSSDYSSEDWSDPENTLRIGVIIDMMNDICNYKSGTGYYILETDIEVDIPRKMYEMLGEIQSICIGADSPDANTLGEQDPAKELQNCRADLSAISNITEQLQLMIGE